jgi:hypothetical protein
MSSPSRLPNVPYPLSTKAFPAKTLGCEGKIEKYYESNNVVLVDVIKGQTDKLSVN